ncbi:hypothetical protein MMC18_001539 [Xylographa bjoerkii]|nr:hypothetical protein [Xylographa bjoerkii]
MPGSPLSTTTPQSSAFQEHDTPKFVLPPPADGITDVVVTIEDDDWSIPQTSSDIKSVRKPEPQPGFSNFWRILSYSNTVDRCLMSAAVIFSAGAGAALPLMNVVFGKLVGSFNGYFIPGSNVSKDEFLASVNQNALYIFYLFIAKFVLDYISIYSFRMTGIRISATIRMTYLTALFKQPISVIDKLPPGAATDSLTTVANTIQIATSDKLAVLVQSIALIISAYVIAFKYSWALTLASSSVILFVFLVYGSIIPPIIKIEHSINESNSHASAVAGEVLKSVRTVKSLCAENAVTARYAKWTAQARERGLKKSPLSGAQFAPAFFSIYANMALTFWFGVKLYSQGNIPNVSVVVIVLFSVLLVVTALGNVFVPIQGINKAASASVACFKIIDAPQLKEEGLKAPEAQATSDILFENVRFTYPSRPRTEIVKGLNLTLRAGKITALVGPSGCGKSTIVGLLERWYQLSDVNESLPFVEEQKDDVLKSIEELKAEKKAKKEAKKAIKKGEKPAAEIEQEKRDAEAGPIIQNSGTIFVGQHNIETLDCKWWRSQIGLVQQEPFLFNETIYNNVAKGLIGSQWEDELVAKKQELVEEACKEAFADEFIRRLPDGYHTMVGESGIKLSGGQRQRLAIARSIIKRPAILVLDEATSSIDVHGERIVQAALDQVSKNRTTITIAHRLSTIRKADHIVVLKEGAAVEEGTHDELVTREDGVYSKLVRAQHLELGGTEDEQTEALEQAATIDADELVLEKTRSKASKLGDAEESPSKFLAAGYKPRGFIYSVGRFLYEQRKHQLIYSLILLGAIGAGSVFATQAYLFSHLIVVFQYVGAQLVAAGNFWSLMFFVLALCVAVCYALIGFCTNSLSVYVSTTYRQEYFESILNKPVPWFDSEDNSSGTLTARLSNDPQQLQEILGPNMALPLVAVFNVTGCTIISFYFGWKLTLVTFFAALPVIVTASFMRIRYEMHFEAFNAKVFAESSKFAAESIGAFRTVAALTLEDTITRHYRSLLDEHVSKAFKKGRLAVLIFALSDSLELCCMALTFWYGGQLLGNHEYGVMQFFIIYIAIVQGGQSAGHFLAFGPNVAQATAAANRILAFRGTPEVVYESHDPPRLSKTSTADFDTTGEGVEIEFRDVGFTYPTRDIPVYKHLSFTIARGDYVAFVGPSGCGKTTVISLLARFYTLSSGQILIDGTDMADVPLAAYRSACALVSQEPTLFEGTVRENLVLGLPHGATDAAVEAACRAAEIHDFITSLPHAYATPLSAGTHASLSGGQKQRLCIARALLRQPRLLLLDEATSSLDSHSESLVQRAIERIARSGQVTIVVVAHRLATVQNAARIVVLGEGGAIREEGTHAELVKRRGPYWGMCSAQALDR